MIPRRLRSILQLPARRRFAVLAEGLELLASNVAILEEDARTLGEGKRDRGAAVLRSFAEEEAAKVMILLDLARAGWGNEAAVQSGMSSFYSHLARGLYVRAYDGSPADLAEVRRYLDHYRKGFYLDGPMDVDWILGNEVLASREERLYVDYIEYENEERRWVGPADREATDDAPYHFPAPTSRIVRLVGAMRRIDVLTEDGLTAIRHVWDGVVVEGSMLWSDLHPINVAVLTNLAGARGRDYEPNEETEAVHFVLDRWIFPLTSLDLSMTTVELAELKREREHWLREQMGDF